MNGGMQRCFNIINQLAKKFELTLIINQPKEEFLKSINEYPAIAEVKIYSTANLLTVKDIFNMLPGKFQRALRYRWYKKQLKGPADGKFLQYYPTLIQLLKQNKYDAVILENLSSLNAVSIIRRYDKSVKIIYDAHNVDSKLASVAVKKWEMKKENLSLINKAESTLYKTVDAVFTCSKNDLDDFIKMNENKLAGVVIPNGVRVGNLYDDGVHQDFPGYILFCGALWSPPNSEGLFWFYNTIWPAVIKSFPGLRLLIVGIGQLPGNMEKIFAKDKSLEFSGPVDDVKPWYNKAAVAIVPLLRGSGTRLKILEAMSLGIPVVSTSKGAEGISYINGKDILIVDKEKDFAEALINLLNNKEARIAIQQSARKLVEEKYDWNIIGSSMLSFIQANLSAKPKQKSNAKPN